MVCILNMTFIVGKRLIIKYSEVESESTIKLYSIELFKYSINLKQPTVKRLFDEGILSASIKPSLMDEIVEEYMTVWLLQN